MRLLAGEVIRINQTFSDYQNALHVNISSAVAKELKYYTVYQLLDNKKNADQNISAKVIGQSNAYANAWNTLIRTSNNGINEAIINYINNVLFEEKNLVLIASAFSIVNKGIVVNNKQ